jgi:ankyrin repeat protein
MQIRRYMKPIAKYVYESLQFQRGSDPKSSLDIGAPFDMKIRYQVQRIAEKHLNNPKFVYSNTTYDPRYYNTFYLGIPLMIHVTEDGMTGTVLRTIIGYNEFFMDLDSYLKTVGMDVWATDLYTAKDPVWDELIGYFPNERGGAILDMELINTDVVYIYQNEPSDLSVPQRRPPGLDRMKIQEAAEFTRGADPKEALGVGMTNQLKKDMLSSGEEWTDMDSALIWASKKGYLPYIRFILSTGANVNATDAKEGTPLMWASSNGHKEAVEILIEAGADPNAQTAEGWSSLTVSASRNFADIVRLLIDAGANVNASSRHGYTALTLATDYGHDEVAEILIDAGATLRHSVTKYIKESVSFTRGENPKSSMGVGMTNRIRKHMESEGREWEGPEDALRWSATHDYPEYVRYLLDMGIDPDSPGPKGINALMLASKYHLSTRSDNTDVIDALVQAGADVNALHDAGLAPLHWAAMDGRTEAVKYLVDASADINAREMDGWTPLMYASGNGHLKTMRVLLEAGADYNIKDVDGWTAIDIAKDRGEDNAVELLNTYHLLKHYDAHES